MAELEWTSEELSVHDAPRPFKSQTYISRTNGAGARRNKMLKQILNNERDAHLQKMGLAEPRGQKKKQDGTSAKRSCVQADEGAASEEQASDVPRTMLTYTSVDAPPSLLPAKRYCDVTGLVGNYTDPKSRMRYHSVEIYDIMKGFVPGVDNA
ncbi:chromatin-remodeling complex subunit ies6 [Malassezia vespertilionis]|uniref:Ies6p n=1 Tax=Malassezia vespertilionis TaxID=2020962 RepID=A0A2N1J8R8_9BASI|nr:chromatin-remodeling complex subunit ies6 [Malassezia vespertilionis]PKI82949.1 Ies6p [Malassezia vespertilionis]WFD08290.1 chromatin-remodeling complex subunit ies6 [Malassezia vespertilionis]